MLVNIASVIYSVEAVSQAHSLLMQDKGHGLVLPIEAGPQVRSKILMDLPKQFGPFHVFS